MTEPAARLDPFLVAFGPFLPERFSAIQADLRAAGVNPYDREAWTLSRAGAEFLQELRPDGGLGEAVEELIAFAHAGYLFWQQGRVVVPLEREALDGLLRSGAALEPSAGQDESEPVAYFVRVAPRRVWGTPVEGAPPEPLDGWFAVAEGGRLSATAVFGLLPGRLGFTVVHTRGPGPGPLRRADDTSAFAPVLPGGEAAGLWSLTGQEELLALAWMVHESTALNALRTLREV